ncbi:GNAT family N-acetyltransferase [uncultured Alsobacter sp.]|uniref:GNAT family N-acetyltransferase n=1 Tax=uncultured Alsobacter sp. TaxID=1748258 RepID=UPI0025EA46AC|nr:GNAT family N-acetyltransferase [uncultured Alsobacter sp.]
MKATLTSLADLGVDRYRGFLARCPDALIYATPEWLSFLERVTGAPPARIIAVVQDDELLAALPLMTTESDGLVVANALPYFGSHGDALIPDCPDAEERLSCLADGLDAAFAELHVAAFNIVVHPTEPKLAKVAERMQWRAWDQRIGQISALVPAATAAAAMDDVLRSCHQKTRNLVRKGMKAGFTLRRSRGDDDWDLLATHHRLGMERINGRFKSRDQFEALRQTFEPHGMCRLYVAERGDVFAGALLLLKHREWIEYFTPVAVEAFRSEQVLSALIAHAMAESAAEGSSRWNWGGTWLTQAGVYHFKQGWGAKDHRYSYLGKIRDTAVEDLTPDQVRELFPFFYVKPLPAPTVSP